MSSIGVEAARILIVDDDRSMRNTLSAILSDQGYETTTASSGEEAISLCDENVFKIIIMDVRMPGINGVEAFRRIRKHCEDVRVILMSAYTVDDLKKEALEDGAIAFLSKPLDLDAVIRLIRDAHETAILVVEDEPNTAKPLCDALRNHGHRVTATTSSQEALILVEQLRFELIFIEAELPVMNGLELYMAVKKITPASVAVMIAGHDYGVEIAQEAVRQTAYSIVHKPLDLECVLKLIDRIQVQIRSDALEKPNG